MVIIYKALVEIKNLSDGVRMQFNICHIAIVSVALVAKIKYHANIVAISQLNYFDFRDLYSHFCYDFAMKRLWNPSCNFSLIKGIGNKKGKILGNSLNSR